MHNNSLNVDSAGIRERLERLGSLPDPAWRAFAAQLKPRHLDKGEFFTKPGERAPDVGFPATGILRMYYVRDDGREFNKAFLTTGDLCGLFDALVLDQPSRLCIEALQPSVLLTVPWQTLAALYERDLHWATIGRRFAELLCVKKMRREESFLLDSAEERYRCFRADHGDIEKAIPDYHVASYIGITPVALSRIKRRLTSE